MFYSEFESEENGFLNRIVEIVHLNERLFDVLENLEGFDEDLKEELSFLLDPEETNSES